MLRETDLFVQGYRPGGLSALQFGPQQAAALRPGIVYVSLSAYGHAGPWAGRRGFDSLVQTASGFNWAEAEAAGEARPRPLPAQALDHAAGYLMAAGAMAALARRITLGGSWHVRVSLAQTAHWLRSLGRLDHGLDAVDPRYEDIGPWLESALRLRSADRAAPCRAAVRHAAALDASRRAPGDARCGLAVAALNHRRPAPGGTAAASALPNGRIAPFPIRLCAGRPSKHTWPAMLSYRHAFHAGNHADVLKHAIVVQLLDHLTQKDKAFWYIDTHAGAGLYALDHAWAKKKAEFETGIDRLWHAAAAGQALPPLLDAYLDQVRALNPDGRLKHYPRLAVAGMADGARPGPPAPLRAAQLGDPGAEQQLPWRRPQGHAL